MQVHRAFPYILLLAAVLLATGCATGPGPDEPAIPEVEGPDPEELMERGEYTRAAEAFARRAQGAKGEQRSRWILEEARARHQAGQPARARSLARGLSDTDQQIPAALLRARILLEQNQPTRARSVLDSILERKMPDEQRSEAMDILGHIHLHQERPGSAFDAWTARYRLLPEGEARRTTQQNILQVLQSMPPERLQQRLDHTEEPLRRGYLRFAVIMGGVGERPVEETRRLLKEWLADFPDHPLRSIVSKRVDRVQAGPLEIAVLLPMNSRYEPLARGLLRGVLAAHYRAGTDRRTNLHILDTAAGPEKTRHALIQARNLGVDAIIGPLTPDAAEEVAKHAAQGRLAAPVLMLNTSRTWQDRSPDLFQFGLDPEEEARQVAERARREGHRRAALLYPDTSRGERLVAAFQKRWRDSDGLTYALEAFDPDESDHSGAIRQLLALDQVHERIGNLESTLDADFVEYKKPPRRKDLDFLFLLAQPGNARLIKPQLEFYAAGDLPALSISSVYSSDDDRTGRRDMDGIQFLQMPWFLDPAAEQRAAKSDLAESYGSQSADLQRLNALGFDAYRLINRGGRLARLSDRTVAATLSGLRMAGGTGTLTVGEDGWVQRRLDWAQYRGGWALPADEIPTPGG